MVGETVHVVSQAGSASTALAGVATYGGAASAAGAQVVAFTPETAATVLGHAGPLRRDPGRRGTRVCRRPDRGDDIRTALHDTERRGDHRCRGDDEARKASGAQTRSSSTRS